MFFKRARLSACLAAILCCGLLPALGRESFNWNTNSSRVSADISKTELLTVLGKIASTTGWKVFVEPQTLHTVSAKFQDLPPGPALRLLLGNVNFALIPGTNSNARSTLYVFRTTMGRATQVVAAADKAAHGKGPSSAIPDQLIVRLKPGVRIEDIAKMLGAKVVGRIDSINTYLLKFEDSDAASSALDQLNSNSDVASVENNQTFNPPGDMPQLSAASAAPPSLQLKDPPASGRIIVGLVDTAVQPLGDGLDSFLLKQLSAVPSADLDPAVPTHGTAMAETILQGIESVTGSGTSVQIQPVNVFPDPDGPTTTFDVLQGMVLAFNSGSKIINLSLGGTEETDAMRDLIDTLAKKDVLVVGAKGNEPTTEPFFPAAYDTVLAVTALEPNGEVAPYANRAPVPALGAPGTSIVYYQRQGWAVSGTSPAAADVSGMAAGYMDKNAASTKQARAWLEQRLPNE